jgi:UDP-2,3-diacylglucosamine pyrophosphatase LpxH
MIGSDITCNTGGHNAILRKLSTLEIRNSKLVDKLTLTPNGKKAWFFYGDVFDIFIQNSKWSAKFEGWGYDLLILGNRFLNFWLLKFYKEKYSLSKKIKSSTKKAE